MIRLSRNLEDRMWQWAVRTQEHGYEFYDRAWIEQLRDGKNWKDPELLVFLSDYGLMRGYSATWLEVRTNRDLLKKECRNAANKILKSGNEYREVADAGWKDVVSICNRSYIKAPYFRKKNNTKVESLNLHSAALKCLWYYVPEKLTMYDKQARYGLARHFGKADSYISPSNFHGHFYEFFDSKLERIRSAKEECESNYDYDTRIADKFLWLRGLGKQNKNRKLINGVIGRFMFQTNNSISKVT